MGRKDTLLPHGQGQGHSTLPQPTSQVVPGLEEEQGQGRRQDGTSSVGETPLPAVPSRSTRDAWHPGPCAPHTVAQQPGWRCNLAGGCRKAPGDATFLSQSPSLHSGTVAEPILAVSGGPGYPAPGAGLSSINTLCLLALDPLLPSSDVTASQSQLRALPPAPRPAAGVFASVGSTREPAQGSARGHECHVPERRWAATAPPSIPALRKIPGF